ncbi:hypothetical protein DH86_00004142, partial [Scytalidium sp. 3C]
MFPRVLLLFGVAGMATSQGYETPTGAFALESTVTSTVYTGVASTSYVFRPGNPPPSGNLSVASTSTTAAPSALLASTVTITTSPPAITSTVYPCADPLPSPGPAYGKYSSPHNLTLVNNLHQGTDGANATDCCNACYFEIENCIQAFYYNVEGCVVAQATNLTSGTGEGVS